MKKELSVAEGSFFVGKYDSNLGLSNRYKIPRYKIQDIETEVAVRVFTYLVSLYLRILYLFDKPKFEAFSNRQFMISLKKEETI